MYQPPHFGEERKQVQHALMRAYPLALLVHHHSDQGLVANSIPMLLQVADDGTERLHCHLAKANDQLNTIDGAEVLAVFRGAQNYVSPSWYETKKEHGKVVPTWNYIVVQVHGTARVIEDRDWLLAHVNQLSDSHESQRPAPWKVSDAPDPFIAGQLKGIRGVEIDISRIEAKWKMGQNRSEADRLGVISGLQDEAPDVADAIQRALPTSDS